MILGVGIDLVEIKRISELLRRQNERFPARILTEKEMEHFRKINNEHRRVEWLAGRFAVKEAAAKAVGSGICGNFRFQDVEVVNDNKGKPELHVSDTVRRMFPENVHFHVSLTHAHTVAAAVVIIEHG